jgi:hypothetical protein
VIATNPQKEAWFGEQHLHTAYSLDAKQGAVYYVRVLLIPTPRWSTYDAVHSGLPLLEGVAATVQDAPGPRRSGTRREREVIQTGLTG